MMDKPKTAKLRLANIRRKTVGGVCLVLGIILVSFFTPIYNVSKIEVSGNAQNDAQTIVAASGINIGENIFKINLADVRRRVSKVAFVSAVGVRRSFPNKIKISVTEGEECAYISFIGNYVGIDEKGKILEIKQQGEFDKPIIYGLKIDNFEIGTTVTVGDEKARNALSDILAQVKSSRVTDAILSVDINDTDNIIMMLRSGVEVKLGNSDSLKYKIAYLKSVLDELGDVSGGVINLADTENVTYRAE